MIAKNKMPRDLSKTYSNEESVVVHRDDLGGACMSAPKL